MSFVRARYMSYLSVYPLCLNSVNAYKIKLNAVCFGVSVITVQLVASSRLIAYSPLYSRNFAFGYEIFIRTRKSVPVPPV